MVDTSISSMSMTYGHSATESVVAILEDTGRNTGLNLLELEAASAYFREARKKYAKFEGSFKGVDSRILVAQVPGGMLTNMENQLREQNAGDKMDQVLEEIPKVREELGFLALVTPTSQIVGTQAVLNVLTGERYKTITKETAAVLKGEYGKTPAPVDKALQAKVLKDGAAPITCRPADKLDPEVDQLTRELEKIAGEKALKIAENKIEDVLIYALFPQIGLKFLQNRGNPDAFEPVPGSEPVPVPSFSSPRRLQHLPEPENYTVTVNGKDYAVIVAAGGEVQKVAAAAPTAVPQQSLAGEPLQAPLAGNIFKILISEGANGERG